MSLLSISMQRKNDLGDADETNQTPYFGGLIMKTNLIGMLAALVFVLASTPPTVARDEAASSSPYESFTIDSRHVDQTFEIEVHIPEHCRANKCPAVYFTDADASNYYEFGFEFFVNASASLKAYGGPDVITVGIGYPGDGLTSNWGMLRWRDFLAFSAAEFSEMPEVSESRKQVFAESGAGGASNFLEFIRQELLPAIESKYSVDPKDRTYVGYSAGSLFGLHILSTYPDTFNRYVIGSAFFKYSRDKFGSFTKKSDVNARLFFGVGLDEQLQFSGGKERSYPWMVNGYLEFAALLGELNVEGLEYKNRTYPDEIHETAWRPIYIQGLRWVFLGDCKPYLYADRKCPS